MEDKPHASPYANLDQLLSMAAPEDIKVSILGADWDRSGSWILLLRLRWRYSDLEETSPENRALLVCVRLTEVEGFTD